MRKTLSRVLGMGEAGAGQVGGPGAVGREAQGAALRGGAAGGGPAGRTKSSPLPGVSGLRNVRPRVPGEPPCRHLHSPRSVHTLSCTRLCAHADTRVHGHIVATHVPGNACLNMRALGAHPQVRTCEHPGTHTHPLSLPTTSCFRAASPLSLLEGLKVTGVPGWAEGKGTPCTLSFG